MDKAALDLYVMTAYEGYRDIENRIELMRDALEAGVEITTILLQETAGLIDSPATREQLASALVSTMVREAVSRMDVMAAVRAPD